MRKLKQIGAGNDKEVFLDPSDPEKKVRVIFRKPLTNEQIKSAIYLNKIARLLLPDNILKVYSVDNKEKSSMSIERVRHDSLHSKLSKLMVRHYKTDLGEKSILSKDDQNLLSSLVDERRKDQKVIEFIHIAREKGLILDSAGQNFSIDESTGILKSLDVDPAWVYEDDGSITINFDKDKLLTSVLELSKDSQQQARSYFNKLVTLFESTLENKGKKINIKNKNDY